MSECVYFNNAPAIWQEEHLIYYKLPKNIRLKNLDHVLNNKIYVIPKIIHQIWITSKEAPREISQKNIELTLNFYNNISEIDSEYQSILWTNSMALIPESVNELKAAGIIIKEISTLELGSLNLDPLIQGKKYGMVSDILRYYIINKEGGVYRDVDYYITKPEILIKIMDGAEFFAGYLIYPFLGNAVFAAKAGHPIIQDAVSIVRRNFDVQKPDYVKKPCNGYSQTIVTTGPIILDVATFKYLQYNDTSSIDLVFSPGVLYDVCSSYLLSNNKNNNLICAIEEDSHLLGNVGNDKLSSEWVLPQDLAPFNEYAPSIKETYHDQHNIKEEGSSTVKMTSDNLSSFFLEISDNNIEKIISILQDNCNIVSLNLILQQVTDQGAKMIVDFLPNSSLEHINLGGNYLNDDFALMLAETFHQKSYLKSLVLWGNNITDHGAIMLIEAICNTSNSSLEFLDLRFNNISAQGIAAIEENCKESMPGLEVNTYGNIISINSDLQGNLEF